MPHLHRILDLAPTAVLLFEPTQGRLCHANRHALQAHGATTLDEMQGRLFGCDDFTARQWLSELQATQIHGPREMRWRTRTVDDIRIWWTVKLDRIDIDGQAHVVAFGHDITQTLATEQALRMEQHRLETVIEALPMGLTIKDHQGRYVLSNKVFEEAAQVRKDVLLGHTAEEVFPPAMAEQICENDQALFGGAPMLRYENAHMRRDGSRKDHLVTKVPLLGPQGEPESILTLTVDISEQKQMQRDLAAAKTEAERLALVKTEFLANMSHEIRTPLHGVLGLAQLGQALPAGDPQSPLVFERISRSGRHLLGVINDILDFSKIDAGKLTIEPAPLDPRQLAEDALAMVDERASAKGLAMRLQCEALPAAVMGDALRIRQILINFLSNGIKFTQRGHVTLTVSCAHGQLYFAVRDSGIGMDETAQARVFAPFEQADGSTSRRFGGTGLGLSISRKLALLMDGDIRLHSAPGEGSTFTLVIPLLQADSDAVPAQSGPPQPAALAAQGAGALPRLQGLRVLAADDVDINRDIISGLLRQHGAEVICADNGLQAAKLHQTQGPGQIDIVLMDLQMPVLDGLQATALIRATDPDQPVVALTAHAMAQERERCLAAGMVGHLAKPFEAEDMIRLILRHARRRPQAKLVTCAATAPSEQVVGSAATTGPSPLAASQPITRLRTAAASPGDGPKGDAQILLDMSAALQRCGGQAGLLRKLIARFSTEQADFVNRCQQLLKKDTEEARRAVHMLRGTSGNLGLGLLSRHAGELESALVARDEPRIGQCLITLNTTLQQHVTLMQRWLAEQVPA
jgi:PAS domain S-box-containing protein